MKFRYFFKQYAYLYCYVLAGFLVLTVGIRGAVETMEPSSGSIRPVVVIDAGHGGIDGGTTSCTGALESSINLDIALRMERLLTLLGFESKMVRTTDESVASEGNSIREQKRSDLQNRVKLVNDLPSGFLLSIHQNHYPDGKYSGAQVFCAADETSKVFGEVLQAKLNQALGGHRTCKAAKGIYLMDRIQHPGILLECGFLSNPQEEAMLRSPAHQKKLCCVVSAALAEFLSQEEAA